MPTKKIARKEAKETSEKFAVGGGTIQIAILGLLRRGGQCGYQIVKELRERDEALDVKYGALYPLLEKLERKGLIKGRWEEGRGQKGLHVYSLTPEGRKALDKSHATWLRVVSQVRSLMSAKA
jgi:PadR family transcriptional regulator PadR